MWSIIFETKSNGEIQEKGFDTCIANSEEDVVSEVKSMIDLNDCDELDIRIFLTKIRS